jgi:hypothetical protein
VPRTERRPAAASVTDSRGEKGSAGRVKGGGLRKGCKRQSGASDKGHVC